MKKQSPTGCTQEQDRGGREPVRRPSVRGQLFSIDAVCGRDLLPAAKRLFEVKQKGRGGWSTWDASSIFFELNGLDLDDQPSARTLILLYAADLRFRLRWQILPALEDGGTVVAAPYVETAIAFGLAFGLPLKWMTELFRFAPRPTAAYWLNGHAPTADSPTAGFLEFCGNILPKDFFEKFGEHFKKLQRQGKCQSVGAAEKLGSDGDLCRPVSCRNS